MEIPSATTADTAVAEHELETSPVGTPEAHSVDVASDTSSENFEAKTETQAEEVTVGNAQPNQQAGEMVIPTSSEPQTMTSASSPVQGEGNVYANTTQPAVHSLAVALTARREQNAPESRESLPV